MHVLTKPLCTQLCKIMAPLSREACICSLSCPLQGKHDKEKPWDHEGINHWEVQRFSKEDNPTGLLEESSFAILFPKYRGEAAQTPAMLHCCTHTRSAYAYGPLYSESCNCLQSAICGKSGLL